ncbi:hypothetical protein BSPWISOXPB_10867 [uncultured Gammaproteobacteria bacterium]|nr:hypothetical protein BSPWISOXPB_10867 [uncultured Gammaproteobacteria bacterium]
MGQSRRGVIQMEAQAHPLIMAIPRFIQLSAFAALKADGSITAWGDSDWEAQAHPLVMAIPRFIQLGVPLPPLKPMDQSRRGVIRILEAQVHPLVMAIPRFIQLGSAFAALKADGQSRRGVVHWRHRCTRW